MTNKEKFREVFGNEYELPPRQYATKDWWEQEYIALEQEPCDDAISREAVKDLFCRICMENNVCYRSKDTCEDLKLFNQLPPVEPSRRKGHWIEHETFMTDIWKCSECGYTKQWKEKFCQNCGADMRESEVSE